MKDTMKDDRRAGRTRLLVGPQQCPITRASGGAPDWPPVSVWPDARPIPQWPRIKAGPSDNLGIAHR
jgi:hypothetical protein